MAKKAGKKSHNQASHTMRSRSPAGGHSKQKPPPKKSAHKKAKSHTKKGKKKSTRPRSAAAHRKGKLHSSDDAGDLYASDNGSSSAFESDY